MEGVKTVVKLLMLLCVTSAAVVSQQQLPQREMGADLAHRCAKLGSLPEDGVPVIMLHEITGTKETWEGLYENIPFLSHRRVCIYDARNHGDSPWDNAFSIDVLADDLGSFMNLMKIEKASLVGHGMGGLTALKFALENPTKVESIFVEDVSPIGIPKDARLAVVNYIASLKRSLLLIPDKADEETAISAIIASVLNDTEERYRVTIEDFPKHFPIYFRDGKWEWKMNLDVFTRALSLTDKFFSKMEGLYNGNVFFIYGKESPFRVGNDEEAIRKIFPNSEFFGIEGSNHMIHSQYSAFFRELIKFLH